MTDEGRKTGRAARSQDKSAVEQRGRHDAWQRAVTDQVIRNVIHYRDVRGYSNDMLRSRLSRLGWELTRDSLASILAGSTKRKVMPMSDCLIFAWALNVPPAALLFPVHTDEAVALSPVSESPLVSAHHAVAWFAGQDAGIPTPVDFEDGTTDAWYEVGDIVARLREHDENLWNFTLVNGGLIAGDYSIEERRVNAEKRAREILEDIIAERKSIRHAFPSLHLPVLRPALRFVDEPGTVLPRLPLLDYNRADELLDGRPRLYSGD